MKISIIYSNEYKYISVEVDRFSIRQWENGNAELCFEYDNGSFETRVVNGIKTINASKITSIAKTNLD